MNTAYRKHPSQGSGTVLRTFVILLTGLLLAQQMPSAGAEDSFQRQVLFSPTQGQLQAEARGRVMIYDGLDEAVVERALDEHFERMEHMMFLRTRHQEPEGGFSYEDDGCD